MKLMCERRNKAILFRQACVSLSQGLWHSMDLTSSQHNHLQNQWVRELERQEGKMFFISLCFLVTLKNIVKYREQSVLPTVGYLVIHFFLKNYVYGICTENATQNTVVVCYQCTWYIKCVTPAYSCPGSFLLVPDICPPVSCLCLAPENGAVTMFKLFREICLQAVS